MFDVRAHLGKNRLYVTLSGTLSEEESHAIRAAILTELGRLRWGFDVVADISQLEGLGPVSVALAKELDEEVIRRGYRRVVRVVGKSAQAAVQLEKVAKESHLEVHLAFSRAEAERMLDGDLTL